MKTSLRRKFDNPISRSHFQEEESPSTAFSHVPTKSISVTLDITGHRASNVTVLGNSLVIKRAVGFGARFQHLSVLIHFYNLHALDHLWPP